MFLEVELSLSEVLDIPLVCNLSALVGSRIVDAETPSGCTCFARITFLNGVPQNPAFSLCEGFIRGVPQNPAPLLNNDWNKLDYTLYHK